MIKPRHRICDICGQSVGVNMRYFIIKSKNFIQSSAGACSDNRNFDICEECMYEISKYINEKSQLYKVERGEEDAGDSN